MVVELQFFNRIFKEMLGIYLGMCLYIIIYTEVGIQAST